MLAILRMKKLVLLVVFITLTTTSNAQENEIGFFIGGSNYVGDIGKEYYIFPNEIMGGVLFKKNVNPRFALRASFTYASIKADDADASNTGRNLRGVNFSNSIKEIAVGIEFNYWEYNISDRRMTKTPYLLIELAAFNYKVVDEEVAPQEYNYKSKTSFAIPFGIGFKSQLVEDFTFAIELRARYTFVDNIDYNNPEIESLNFGNPDSNDWYMFSGITFTYSFGRPPCYARPF